MALQAAVLAYHNRRNIAYSEGWQRWDGITNHRHAWRGEYPHVADCSSFVTWCIYQGLHHYGVRDVVNGLNWRAGYTGTMLNHGHHVSRPFPGVCVTYGPGTGSHEAIYTGGGLVVSHGNQAGPLLLPLHYRGDETRFRSYIW